MSTTNFEQANQKVHAVEDQWHYPILTKYGFVAQDKTGVGFVRSYNYHHSSGVTIRCTTGSSADYWTHLNTKHHGYYGSLEGYLKSLHLD